MQRVSFGVQERDTKAHESEIPVSQTGPKGHKSVTKFTREYDSYEGIVAQKGKSSVKVS